MFAINFAISAETITAAGLYVLLPLFIGLLFFIVWDISKKSKAGRAGVFWTFLILGAGFMVFIIKMVLEVIFDKWIL